MKTFTALDKAKPNRENVKGFKLAAVKLNVCSSD
jgi:hypothetical protein